jgi:hypothetical protein
VFEILFLLAVVAAIVVPAVLLLKLSKIEGLKSFKGVVTFLAFVLSWGAGFFTGLLFVPLMPVACFAVQVIALTLIARVNFKKAVVISLIYTAVGFLLLGLLGAILAESGRFS